MINKVTLIGYLGSDPEVRTLENGIQVARISLATSESWKDAAGEWQQESQWHNVVAWRDLAAKSEKQLKKGKLVYVEGKLSTRKYTGSDGVERWATDIVAANIRLLEKSDHAERDARQWPDAPPARFDAAPSMPNVPQGGVIATPATGDDIPF